MNAWTDQFATPGAQTLIAEVPDPHDRVLTDTTDWLDRVDGFDCEVRWMGLPWRWTIVYREDDRDALFVIPDPESPKIAMQIGVNTLAEADMRRLSRPVREGLARARVVGQTVWAEWDLSTPGLAANLDELVNRLWRDAALA